MKTIIQDNRAIKMLTWPDDTSIAVGSGGVTQIEPYQEPGPMGSYTWYAVWRGDAISDRVNGSQLLSITYRV